LSKTSRRHWGLRLAVRLLLVGVTPAAAQTATMTNEMTDWLHRPTYTFKPKDDVTAPELAKALVAILPALTCRNPLSDRCDVSDAIEALPAETKRHFVKHGDTP
jgi:hypothetical protein